MKNNDEVLEPRLVPVDSYYLSVINDRIQDLSNDAESLAMALNAINADDEASKQGRDSGCKVCLTSQ